MINDGQCAGECQCASKRQRVKSLPSAAECWQSNNLSVDFVRRHRNSEITINKSFPLSTLREVSSEPSNILVTHTEVGVKAYLEWKPRNHSISASLTGRTTEGKHEESLLGDIKLERSFVLSPSELQNVYYKPSACNNNPLKSELFLRVLYMLASTVNEDQDTLHSIQDQFLSDEQIRENLLKELRDGVSRLNQDLCHNECTNGKSESVTPVEFLCNTLPNIMRRHSFVNIKSPELSHVSSSVSMDSQSSDCDVNSLRHQHSKKKATGKLSGLEKNLFAPLTF